MSNTNCSDEDDVIKQRVVWWRQAIVRCIRTPELASRLAQYDVINSDEKFRLVHLYQQTPDEASNELLDILIKQNRPRKWQDFIEALKTEGFEYVISRLIPHQMETLEERERGRKLVQLFGPELEQDIDPIPLLSYLKSKKVLKDVDADEITNLTLNKSKVLGMMRLLDRVQCYLKPSEWWNHLLCALWTNGHEQKVEQLEPGYEPSNQSDVHANQVDADSDNDVSACPAETVTSTALETIEDSVALSEVITYPPEQEKHSFKTCVGNDTEESLKRGRSENTDDVKAFEGCSKNKEVPSPKSMQYVVTEDDPKPKKKVEKPKEKPVSSESGSGSESDEQKPKKKVEKPKEKQAVSKTKPKADEGASGEHVFQISNMRYATVSAFRGKVMVGIREFYNTDGEMRHGKKGISLPIDQWMRFKDQIEEIDAAVKTKPKAEKGPSGEHMFHISNMRYATVSAFRGKVMVGIREFYNKDGEMRHGKKGISLPIDQWKRLKDQIEEIDAAVNEMS